MGSPKKLRASVNADADLRRDQRQLNDYVETNKRMISLPTSNESDLVLKKLNALQHQGSWRPVCL